MGKMKRQEYVPNEGIRPNLKKELKKVDTSNLQENKIMITNMLTKHLRRILRY